VTMTVRCRMRSAVGAHPSCSLRGTGFGTASWGEFGNLLATRRRVITYRRRKFTPPAPAPCHRARSGCSRRPPAAAVRRLASIVRRWRTLRVVDGG
jgi:hypothetical protein